jgi:hypothetical protein
MSRTGEIVETGRMEARASMPRRKRRVLPAGTGLLAAVLLLLAGGLSPATAQRMETLVNSRAQNGGFGGPVMKVGELFGDPVLFLGGRGAWVAGRTFALGGGGYGLVNDNLLAPMEFAGRRAVLEMGYGGLELEYIHESHRLAHLSLYTLMGGGGARYRDRDRYETLAEDGFLVLEPGMNMNLNVTRFFRLSAGATYRWTFGAELPGLDDRDLSGPTGVFALRFGRY